MAAENVQSSSSRTNSELPYPTQLTAPSAPRSDPVPIPRRSNATSGSYDSYFAKGAVQMDREDEEYEQLKRMYSDRTWEMFHRIQAHRKQQEAKEMSRINMIPKVEAPGYFTVGPTPLLSFMPVLLAGPTNEVHELIHTENEEKFPDEELIFGDLEE